MGFEMKAKRKIMLMTETSETALRIVSAPPRLNLLGTQSGVPGSR
jgi:hypothetical protein